MNGDPTLSDADGPGSLMDVARDRLGLDTEWQHTDLTQIIDGAQNVVRDLASVTAPGVRACIEFVAPDGGKGRRLFGRLEQWHDDGQTFVTFYPDVVDVPLPPSPTFLEDGPARLDHYERGIARAADRLARAGDPDTSHEAARSVAATLNQAQAKVLALFRTDPAGMTDEQLVAAAFRAGVRLSQSGLRTRRAELVRAGKLRDTGQRETTASNRRAIVWAAT